jgi:hypothetical protein
MKFSQITTAELDPLCSRNGSIYSRYLRFIAVLIIIRNILRLSQLRGRTCVFW